MTYITGPYIATKSTPVINDKPQEHVIRMRVVNRTPAQVVVPVRATLIVVAIITLVMLFVTGIILVMATSTFGGNTATRYRGFCTIPIKDVPDELGWYEQPSYKVMPLRWTEAADEEPDAQILTAEESGDVIAGLKEHFDIGDRIEKISVVDNGRHVNFIHDFEDNVTGIVDTDRCFTMELDRSAVLAPALLVLSIEGGAPFDVSRVRATLRAALPALRPAPAALADPCRDKPLYRLHSDHSRVVKRSLDAPSHDYIQFAGRRVQEIDIENLADLLQHEQDLAAAPAAPPATP